MSQSITAVDFFCGAGGSSTGLVAAGIEVKGAANHWALAIETHNTNHPETEHYLDDLQVAHASRFPRADIAWFSPSCTNHSLAKGRKRKGIAQLDLWGESGVDPSEEKSRATMREVVEFTEYHRYAAVIVENVVDIRHWQWYDEWLTAMLNMGYEHKVLYLNAQFFGVPQSRDRFYAVFWKRGNRAPKLDFRPSANCSKHGAIHAVQVFKKTEFQWGRFGNRRQYTYRCPQCGEDVMPAFRPAADVIDWSLPSEKIGDRKKPLKDKTIARILAGLKKFGKYPHVADLSHSHAAHDGKVHSVANSLPTQTSQQRHALVQPFLLQYYDREEAKGWPVSRLEDALPVIRTQNVHALVQPPFISTLRGPGEYLPGTRLEEPLSTIVAAASQQYLVQPPFIMAHYSNPVFKSIDDPMPTQVEINHHSLITPPFMTSLNHSDIRNTPVDEAMPTVMPYAHPALVTPVVMSYYGNTPTFAPVDEPLPTMRTVAHEALITPEDLLPECGFRMLEPRELKLGMSFPDSYTILGNRRDQVKQVGNAVCPNVAQWIAERIVESLA